MEVNDMLAVAAAAWGFSVQNSNGRALLLHSHASKDSLEPNLLQATNLLE